MIIKDTAQIEQKIASQLNSAAKGYLNLDRRDYENVSLGTKSMVVVEVNNIDFNEAVSELKTDLAKLNPVAGDMLVWIKSAVLTMEQFGKINDLISEMEGANLRKQAILNEGDDYSVMILICQK